MKIVVNVDSSALREEPRAVAIAARGVLLGVVCMNIMIMRSHIQRKTPLPKLYKSGVEFAPEPNQGKWEDFADCLTVLDRGWGDCDDLVAYRVAELRANGEDPKASVKVYWRDCCPRCAIRFLESQGPWCPKCGGKVSRVYHAQVRRGNMKSKDGRGVVEDPARLLGM